MKLCRFSRPRAQHRHQHGALHLFGIGILIIIVVLVLNRHALQQAANNGLQRASSHIARIAQRGLDTMSRIATNLLNGNFSFSNSQVMVQPSLLDELFSSDPDLASMAHHLPPLQSVPPHSPPRAPTLGYCLPLSNTYKLDHSAARALQNIATPYTQPKGNRCGGGLGCSGNQ